MNDLFGPRPMKALSLWQPWAALVATYFKLHETRHWSTPYRGPIAIHAAKTVDVAGAPEELCTAALGTNWRDTVPRGAMVAIGRLARCGEASRVAGKITAADLEAGNFTPGRFAWAIEDVRVLKTPIPTLGRQGLWNWTPPANLEDLLDCTHSHADACRLIGWA